MIADYAQDSAMQIAEVYAWRGEKDKAPLLVSLHAGPRFDALVRRIGLRQGH